MTDNLKRIIKELVEEGTSEDLTPDELAEKVREPAWQYQIQESGESDD